MTATMSILGWKSEGLRCPDHTIDCCDHEGKPLPITLIQMPNGTGKTTTLSLLRAALSGSADGDAWSEDQVMEFQKLDGYTETGIFELRLLLDDRRVTIILEFDFESGRIFYKTTHGEGQKERFDPPEKFQRFMNEDFVRFYVFDGELADNILSQEHTDAQNAIESLFQINLLSRIQKKIEDYWHDQTRDVTAKDRKGLKRRHKKLEEWRLRLKELEEQRDRYRKELEGAKKELEHQQEQYNNKIRKKDDLNKHLQEAKDNIKRVESLMQEKAQGVLDSVRDPHAISPVFASSIYGLKSGLDRVKLPESAAREFFEELSEEDSCICGRPIDDEIKHTIKNRARQYLGSDDVSLLNSMKSAIEEALGESETKAAEDLSENAKKLEGLIGEQREAKNKLDLLELEAGKKDPDVLRAQTEIHRLNEKIFSIEGNLSQLEGSDEKFNPSRIESENLERIFSIEAIKEGIDYLEDKVAEISNTLNLRLKRDLLNRVIENAHTKARNYVTSELKDETNKRIAKLMPNNPIRIHKIDRCVVLEDRSSGSAGENLSIGYAFLATLFKRSGEHNLPFIVDSPAGPIDFEIRPEIGRIAPTLTDQFIAFVISSEREQFLPFLQSTAKEKKAKIKYITLFRKGSKHHAERARKNAGCITTDDGIQVNDKKFFSDFQIESEEDA